ncbi:MAG: peptidase M20 [Gammaproteobacteria bacterium RIFCSPHIGHO2_12_FULL_42_13]|nr:MAG: peptidase M20 [Gammaproteobacteria bacterium RIFCSPHIGHO2_12_FULL_42_13]
MTQQKLKENFSHIENQWDHEIIPELVEYIKIPAKSPLFDKNWRTNGHIHNAMTRVKKWCEKQPIKNMKIDLLEIENRTPVLLIDIPGQSDETVLLYGHIDKQPEMKNWRSDLGPWKPVLEDGKLYGRGGADDGYAVFSALSAVAYLQKLAIPHGRCVVLIEACEESGSFDLPPYLALVKKQIGEPSFIICLDSACGNYEQLWGTTSLRGIIGGVLKVNVLSEGVHSGIHSGVVPSVFHVLRLLLDRIEDPHNGYIHVKDLHVSIPEHRLTQIREAAKAMGDEFYKHIPFLNDVQPICKDVEKLILNNTWEPALSLTGMDGVPSVIDGGNVTLPDLSVKLSMRLPPTCDVNKANHALKATLEKDPPFHAKVVYEPEDNGPGWHSPALAPWLEKANQRASQLFYGKDAAYLGIGATIPFMGMLGEMFPKAQYLITGVLGPKSNAHGPNEFLHIEMAKKLTGCVASVIADHFAK